MLIEKLTPRLSHRESYDSSSTSLASRWIPLSLRYFPAHTLYGRCVCEDMTSRKSRDKSRRRRRRFFTIAPLLALRKTFVLSHLRYDVKLMKPDTVL